MSNKGNVLQFCVGFTVSVGVYLYIWEEIQIARAQKLTLLSLLEKELSGEARMRPDEFDLSALDKLYERKPSSGSFQRFLAFIKYFNK
jgi:hypothetical protein